MPQEEPLDVNAILAKDKALLRSIRDEYKKHSKRKSGRPSVKDRCFDAIWEGLHECGAVVPVSTEKLWTGIVEMHKDGPIDYFPHSDGAAQRKGKFSWIINYEGTRAICLRETAFHVPQGRLAKMIIARIPGISEEAAKKYARLWERDQESDASQESHQERMKRYEDLRVRHRDLYVKSTKKKRP